MKKTYILLGILIFLVMVVFLFRIMESKLSQTIQTTCCRECIDAFSSSPVGVGPAAAKCGEFTTGKTLSTSCLKYFTQNSMMVSACTNQ